MEVPGIHVLLPPVVVVVVEVGFSMLFIIGAVVSNAVTNSSIVNPASKAACISA